MSSTESESAPSSGLRDPTISEPTTPRSTVSASSPAVAEDATRSERFGTKAVSIPYGVEREGVVYYTVNVLTDDDEKWSCQKRFSAFERLHQVVVGLFGHKGQLRKGNRQALHLEWTTSGGASSPRPSLTSASCYPLLCVCYLSCYLLVLL